MGRLASFRGVAFVVASIWTLVLAIGAFGGCGDDSGDSSSPDTAAVEVVASEYAFELPEKISGGLVTLDFVNEGAEPHEYALVKGEAHTVEELDEAIAATVEQGGEPPRWVKDAGNYGVQTSGASISITDELEPGSYEFVCFIPGPGKKNHLELGMKRAFTVSGDTGASSPTADAVITATRERFEIPAIAAGEQTLEVRTDGPEPSAFQLLRFEPGKDLGDVERWFGEGLEGKAPAVLFGGAEVPVEQPVFFAEEFQSGGDYELVNPETQARAEIAVE